MQAIEIFIAYSHQDLKYKDELKKFLRPLLNTRQAVVWDDHDIEAGQDWEAEIKKRLYQSEIILLLVSPDSLASDYFYGREVAVSLERHERGEAVVVPVILRPCAWTITPLKKIEALPSKGKPIASWASQDEAFTEIAHAIGDLVEGRQTLRRDLDERETARRAYEAAAETAAHLFDNQRFEEARRAYAALTPLYHPGFVPDAAAVETRLADCAARLRQIAETEAAVEAEQARQLRLKQEEMEREIRERREREQREHETEQQRQSEETTRLENERKAEAKRAAEEARQQRLENNPKHRTDNASYLYGGIAAAALLLLLLFVWWKPWEKNAATDNAREELQEFNEAKKIRTVSDWQKFISRHPNSKLKADALKEQNRIRVAVKELIQAAYVLVKLEEPAQARDSLNKALRLDPENSEVRQKLNELKTPQK